MFSKQGTTIEYRISISLRYSIGKIRGLSKKELSSLLINVKSCLHQRNTDQSNVTNRTIHVINNTDIINNTK